MAAKGSLSLLAELGLQPELPGVGPHNVRGIEINPYAAELARVSVWIGDIQWMLEQGYGYEEPILKPLDNIECCDAILTADGDPDWPTCDVVIGNPPFLGGKLLARTLGDEYVASMFKAYQGKVPREADLVTYWLGKAGEQVAAGKAKRAGLVSTSKLDPRRGKPEGAGRGDRRATSVQRSIRR